MGVFVEMQHIGEPSVQSEVRGLVEHVFANRPGNWRVSLAGSQANDVWEMKIFGPSGFERSYTLEGSAGQHDPRGIGQILARMLPGK